MKGGVSEGGVGDRKMTKENRAVAIQKTMGSMK